MADLRQPLQQVPISSWRPTWSQPPVPSTISASQEPPMRLIAQKESPAKSGITGSNRQLDPLSERHRLLAKVAKQSNQQLDPFSEQNIEISKKQLILLQPPAERYRLPAFRSECGTSPRGWGLSRRKEGGANVGGRHRTNAASPDACRHVHRSFMNGSLRSNTGWLASQCQAHQR